MNLFTRSVPFKALLMILLLARLMLAGSLCMAEVFAVEGGSESIELSPSEKVLIDNVVEVGNHPSCHQIEAPVELGSNSHGNNPPQINACCGEAGCMMHTCGLILVVNEPHQKLSIAIPLRFKALTPAALSPFDSTPFKPPTA